MCFVEYSDIQQFEKHNQQRVIHFCSVETLSSRELMARFNNKKSIPSNVSKCKRIMIRNGLYQEHYSHSVAHKIVQFIRNRMVAIRNLINTTLCLPVGEQKRDRSSSLPNKFGQEDDPEDDPKDVDEIVTASQRSVRSYPSKHCDSIHSENQKRQCTTCHQEQCRHTILDTNIDHLESIVSNLVLKPSPLVSLLLEPGSCHINDTFQFASGISNKVDTQTAVRSAFGQVCKALDSRYPHMMIVSYSIEYDADQMHKELHSIAPKSMLIGSTSDLGLFTQSNSIYHGRAIAILGIYDPKGAYGFVNSDFHQTSVKEGTLDCLQEGRKLLAIKNEKNPDMTWLSISHGNENSVIQALDNELVGNCVILAGGSLREHVITTVEYPSESSRHPTQLCSHATHCSKVTSQGVAMAFCCPSIQILHAFFTCYEPISTKTLTVTQTCGDTSLEKLNKKPALSTLDTACCGILHECVSHPQKYDISSNLTPLYYPLGRESSTSRFQIIQPFLADSHLALKIDVPVKTREKLRLMSMYVDSTRDHFMRNFGSITESCEVHGCQMTLSSNYIHLEQKQTRRSIASIMWKLFPSSVLLGTVSDGQQGRLSIDERALHANGIISAVVFTLMKK
uniref:Uncharacterized protein AlNc14C417G11495 n=1 Tax=Albugo laibachii Nc14 TaxID=890382 RepID=F0WZ89_9STRA|nr:conserved hypothetical protein [Albugo laibachii Nc14]|eukprot:CCA26806.1 conserved hypothetical protein [Albugo laibachii Nc14]